MFRGFVSWAIICQDEQTPHFEAGLRKFSSSTSFEERPGATCQSHEPTKCSTLATLFSLFNFSFSSCRSLRTLPCMFTNKVNLKSETHSIVAAAVHIRFCASESVLDFAISTHNHTFIIEPDSVIHELSTFIIFYSFFIFKRVRT